MSEIQRRRLADLRKKLRNSGVDSFVGLASPDNFYLSGFSGSTSAILVNHERAVLLCDPRYTEQAGNEVSEYAIEEVRARFLAEVGQRLKDLSAGKVGFDPAYMTVAQRDAIEKTLGYAMLPIPELVSGLRLVKSTDEVDRITAASNLAEKVLLHLLEELTPGTTERELAARFEYEFKRGGASGASFDTIVLFGGRSSLPHGQPSDRPLKSGDIILMDFGCLQNGYCSDLTRTCVFDTIPGAWFEQIYEVTLRAQRAAVAAVCAGIPCKEIDAVARGIITEAGFGPEFGHGLGHGVGIEIHEGPRLNAESESTLEEGMVVTVEPGIYLPGRGGVRIEDLVVVTKDGCTVLTRTETDLKVLK